ncbi:hypothetical protein KHA80_21000 [Anaerobacillus sp. HL2]|nr:hypothetical protein KHA80_21000 [Anaerobacillus sp. HL2]
MKLNEEYNKIVKKLEKKKEELQNSFEEDYGILSKLLEANVELSMNNKQDVSDVKVSQLTETADLGVICNSNKQYATSKSNKY